MNSRLTIALPKGRLAQQVLKKLNAQGLPITINPSSRVLIQTDENNYEYMFVKPSDVITYVEEGVCDIGFVGSDSILEERKDIYELVDLKIGVCKMVIAGKDNDILEKSSTIRVASKYPYIAKTACTDMGINATIVKLNGSVELGPLVGLSDVIVDIYETGNTLKANNLQVLKELFDISTRLIANKASFRRKRQIIERIITILDEEVSP
ncbi:ATP phosphoribosyltransferase [Candidatus Xianfuyuplasma coldseepsis]|uniref:ATP phosphoribosyltransferase n=1 Tax=Candidatus Xianfuyuplasma coldseepsis TaxID=2782163 RepID=A0A7L7KQS0_9MOLU|nr:ATP phosphoribosyltransferase [Xianfuyuplasma coldseepsis]QMS84779.1 ATP phosphoribosyltransferase [Xianfuyuplasma coldseepsis]